jgi:acetoin utilization deacetylase AcuC-like enzyme
LVVVGPGSYEIALLSTGGCLAALDSIMAGEIQNAYALVRPPGHHAEPESGFGFCLFNNVAITAKYARQKYGIERIAIVDWDVHSGNGTQKSFYEDPDTLFISIHQIGNYPVDQGFVKENGAGAGEGYNINIPLPPGCGHGAYDAAFERVIVPALGAFKPQLILVSSGFDACFMDPQASMMLSSTDFRYFTKLVKRVAHRHSKDRLLIIHEGGYSDEQVPFCGLAVCEELSGLDSGVSDPFVMDIRMMGEQDLQPHQDARISECETLVTKLQALCKARGI